MAAGVRAIDAAHSDRQSCCRVCSGHRGATIFCHSTHLHIHAVTPYVVRSSLLCDLSHAGCFLVRRLQAQVDFRAHPKFEIQPSLLICSYWQTASCRRVTRAFVMLRPRLSATCSQLVPHAAKRSSLKLASGSAVTRSASTDVEGLRRPRDVVFRPMRGCYN